MQFNTLKNSILSEASSTKLSGKVKLGKTTFSLAPQPDGSVSIDRIFLEPSDRGKGEASKGLAELVKIADEQKITLFTTIMPDDETDENYDALRHIFGKFGFTPDTIDGEVYRNDLTRIPGAKK